MKTIIISIVVITILVVIFRAAAYDNAIRHGRCPKCGAPIVPFYNDHCEGLECTECEWFETTD